MTLRAKAIVFTSGALERPLVFNNNDRPGVMLAGAVRSYLNRFAISPGKRAIVTTNNDSAYRTALDLAGAGLTVTLADLRRDVSAELRTRAAAAGIELRPGTAVVDVEDEGLGAFHCEFARAGNYRTEVVVRRRIPAEHRCDDGGGHGQ